MTLLEMRAMLRRVDARQLRRDAGIQAITVARWARVIAGLERHAEVETVPDMED